MTKYQELMIEAQKQFHWNMQNIFSELENIIAMHI